MEDKNQTIAYYVQTAAALNRSIPIPLLIFGTIGNLLNLYILSQKSLRANSCSFYFLSSTIANLVCLWCGLFTRMLSGYSLDPAGINDIACKFRYFITYMALALSACFLVYASIDRWASSSPNAHIRLFSRIRIAQRLVIGTVLLSLFFYGQAFYCYSVSTVQPSVGCTCPNVICRMYNDLLFLILFSVIPPPLMICFGWGTIRNIKKIRQHINPNSTINNQQRKSVKKKDRQMVTMLLIQVILFSICVTPSGISKGFSVITFNQQKDSVQLIKENFFFQVKFEKKQNYYLFFVFTDFCTYSIHQLLLRLLYLYISRHDLS